MKQLISLMALMLIQKNGTTTNLDIKNALRKQFDNDSSFRLTQADVHNAMNEIAKEQGLVFTLSYSVEGHEYRVWALPTVANTADPAIVDTDATVLNDDDALKSASQSLLTDAGQPNTVDNGVDNQSAPVTPAQPAYPVGFGPQLDPSLGDVTAYWTKDTKVTMQGNDKKTIQKDMLSLMKSAHPGLKYDDIRVCSTTYYNKSVAGK